MKVSDLAKSLGIHPVTVKRLEKLGVVQPLRDRNGWRRYTEEDLKKIRKILLPAATARIADREIKKPPTGASQTEGGKGETDL